jgi:hypothetical protein
VSGIGGLIKKIEKDIEESILNGPFEPTFYKNLLTIRKYQKHNSRSLVNYFQRYRDVFFGKILATKVCVLYSCLMSDSGK